MCIYYAYIHIHIYIYIYIYILTASGLAALHRAPPRWLAVTRSRSCLRRSARYEVGVPCVSPWTRPCRGLTCLP